MTQKSEPTAVIFAFQQRRAIFLDVIWYVLIIVFLWLVEFVGMGRTTRGWAELIVAPALSQVTRLVQLAETPFYMMQQSFRATRRIQDLELRYSTTLAELGELQALEKENQALKALLENSDRTLVNNIITRPIVSFAHPTIAAGSSDGVQEGSLILLGKTVVGSVSEVSEHTAKVNLLFQNSNRPIVAATETGVEGLLVGDGKRLVLTEVARDAEVIVGQRVVTLGQPGVPPDLFLGQVVVIESKPADPVKQVVIEQLVDFYQARVVEVLP